MTWLDEAKKQAESHSVRVIVEPERFLALAEVVEAADALAARVEQIDRRATELGRLNELAVYHDKRARLDSEAGL